jgi:lysophospholipid acyltransferase (LPLAT)-like uncharacterized protein
MKFAGFLIFLFYRLLIATWRIRIEIHPQVQDLIEKKKNFILVHWHADIQALIHLMLRYRVAAMISRSKDGDLVAAVAEHLGGTTARGSSSKGGIAAFKEMIRLARAGWIPSLAMDGPRGPARVPKFGVFELAKVCDIPIVPIGVISSHSYVFQKAWDGGYIPYPFSKITIYFSEPVAPIMEFSKDDYEKLPQMLAERMDGARQHVTKLIAARHSGC